MKKSVQLAGAAAGVALGAAIALFMHLDGLSADATCALGVLAGAIVWWVVGVLPEYVVALVMAVVFIVAAHVPSEVVFSQFAGSTWWLLVAAFGLGLGMQKSGLMRRMALAVVRVFPKTFKSQAAGLMAAGTLIGPFIPSLSAKAAMLAPLSLGISDSMGYARQGRQATGLFLAMFTGLRNVGPAVISASIIGYGLLALLPEDVVAQFDMLHWFLAMLPWFIVVTALNYVAIVALYGDGGKRRRTRNADAAGAEESAGAEGEKGARRAAPAAGDTSAGSMASAAGDVAQAEDKPGPMTRHEKQMVVIMTLCIALWVLEPVHHIASHVVAIAALVATLACGIFSKADFRSGISWDSLVFMGVVFGLAEVFAYLGIDAWIVEVCQPVFTLLASNAFLFVGGVAVITVLLRFVIVSEMAYVNLFMAFMVPLSLALGVNPWVVGVTVYAMVNPWFTMYQNPIYLTAFYAVDGKMARHAALAKYCVLYVAICLCGLMVSVPLWQSMGLL